jgi:hypothetical protein
VAVKVAINISLIPRFVPRALAYPFLFLLLGPPIFRVTSERTADASLSGSFDLWILFQFGWYLAVAMIVIPKLLKQKTLAALAFRSSQELWLSLLFLTFLLLASTVLSPSPAVTLAYVVMFTIGVFGALHLAVGILQDSQLSMIRLYATVRSVSAVLIVLATGAYFVFPSSGLGEQEAGLGLRILGGAVAPVPLLAVVVVTISMFFFAHRCESPAKSALYASLGVVSLILSQTRTAYLAVLVAVLLATWGRQRALPIIGSGLVVLSALSLWSSSGIVDFIVRDPESVATGSGRTFIAAWVFEEAIHAPFGLGYVAGFRSAFMREGPSFAGGAVVVSRIGNAHDSFLEILIGGGWLALVVFVFVICCALYYLRPRKRLASTVPADLERGRKLTLILLICIVVMSFAASDFVLGGRASFAYFLLVLSTSAAVNSRFANIKLCVPVGYGR